MRATVCWATAAMVLCGVLGTARAADDAEVEKLRQENAALKQRVAELEAELANTRTTAEQAAARAKAAEQSAAAASAERDAAVADKAAIESEHRQYLFDRSYDAASDTTTITGRVTPLAITGGVALRHWMNLGVQFAGKTPTKPVDAVKLVIQTSFTGTLYKNADELTLSIDGKEQTLAVALYDNVMRSLGSPRNRVRKDDETVTVELPLATLRAIGEAKSVTGAIAGNRFELSRDQRNTAAELVKALEAK